MLALSVYFAGSARAFVFVAPVPSLPNTGVGQTAPAALGIGNFSTPPESVTNPVLTISLIDLYPACSTANVNCTGGTAEAGVYAFSPTGTGSSSTPGNTSCEGAWTIAPDTGNTATATRYRFTPPGGEGTVLLATGEVCTVSFTSLTRRVPTIDVASGNAGVQTNHVGSSTATGPTIGSTRNSSSDQSTVNKAMPGLATQASSAPAQGGTPPPVPASTTDTATLSSPPPPSSSSGAAPSGTITFNLHGPDDATCTGAPLATNIVPVNGFGTYTTTEPVSITAAGTYRWVAAYSGDTNYVASANTCGDPQETLSFSAMSPLLSRPAVVRTSTTWIRGDRVADGAATSTLIQGTKPLVPVIGDWDGNGSKTPASYEGGSLKLRNDYLGGPPAATVVTTFDVRGFPVAGDFNGDGIDDLAVFRAGLWQIRLSTGTVLPSFSFGSGSWPSTVPVAGDWDGDGTDGIGVYDLASGTWHLRNGVTTGPDMAPFVFWAGMGTNSYPVVGDWDANGTDTVGIKATTIWSLRSTNSPGPADTTFTFGLANDLPLSWR